MALNFGRKDSNDNEIKSESKPNLNIHQEQIPEKDKFDIKEIEEIKKISKRLDSDEKVENRCQTIKIKTRWFSHYP